MKPGEIHQCGGLTSTPVPTPPEAPTQDKILAATYETHDAINALAQRIFNLEGSVHKLSGELEEVRQLLVRVQPEQLARVIQGLESTPVARVKRVLRDWLA
jgi:hypothetical protein